MVRSLRGPIRNRFMTHTIVLTTPSSGLYGADRMVIEDVEAFLARGWKVVVAFRDRGPLCEEISRRGAEVEWINSPLLQKSNMRPVGALRLIATAIRSIPSSVRFLRRHRPDVVYVNTIIQPFWIVLARCMRMPVVCHVHEGEQSAPRWVQWALATPLLLTRRIVINSRFSAGVVTRAMPRLSSRSAVLYNGVQGPPGVTDPRPAIDGDVRLLFLGRLSERKGIFDAVDIVARLNHGGTPAVLDVVGAVTPGSEWIDDRLDRQIRLAAIGDRVRFHGFDVDVWPHLERCDILLVPSRLHEPFGNTAVEGLLAARPVVVSDAGGLPEAIEGSGAALASPPGDVESFAAAVRQIVTSWPQFREAAIEESAAVAKKYSPAGYRRSIADTVEAVNEDRAPGADRGSERPKMLRSSGKPRQTGNARR
jgi:glycosyltransferase involved in cell wall biosynthesis